MLSCEMNFVGSLGKPTQELLDLCTVAWRNWTSWSNKHPGTGASEWSRWAVFSGLIRRWPRRWTWKLAGALARWRWRRLGDPRPEIPDRGFFHDARWSRRS
jgi:hypothetical protein